MYGEEDGFVDLNYGFEGGVCLLKRVYLKSRLGV